LLVSRVWCPELTRTTTKISWHTDCFLKELVIEWKRNNLGTIACLMGLFQVPQILILRRDIKMLHRMSFKGGNLIWRCIAGFVSAFFQ